MNDNNNQNWFNPIENYHHIQFYVSNALQACYLGVLVAFIYFHLPFLASFFYCFHFGFERFAHRRSREYSEIAVRNGRNESKIVFVFKNMCSPNDPEGIGSEIAIHGDFVKDVAYSVDNLDLVLQSLNRNGHGIIEAKRESMDEHGSVLTARISGSAGSIVHTLIQNLDYKGSFLPGFKPIENFNFCKNLSPISFIAIDHVVEAHPEHSLENVAEWYHRILGMRRFWSIDDKLVHAEFSALKALLVGNKRFEEQNGVKVTLVEPVNLNGTKRRGQVQEFLDFHGQSGVQHIAFLTQNIVQDVQKLRERGVKFIEIPKNYYDLLEERLAVQRKQNGNGRNWIEEDLAKIRELGILMDFDENGYLLQIFTKPVQDRATLFLEIIQRHNFNGFGAGNFKALFAAVEMEQKRRDSEFGAAEAI